MLLITSQNEIGTSNFHVLSTNSVTQYTKKIKKSIPNQKMMIEDGIKLPSEPWCSILQGQVGISIHCNLQNASNGQEKKTSLSD